MANKLPFETSQPPHKDAVDRQSNCENTAITGLGQILSRPEECRLQNSVDKIVKDAESALKGFAPAENLLNRLERHQQNGQPSEKTAGPIFPLQDLYDPEKPYTEANGKPTPRGEELKAEAKKLVDGASKPDGSLTLKDHGKIMDTINKEHISEADKWYLYKQVCREESKGRDAEGRLRPDTKEHRVLFNSNPPHDLPISGKGDVVRHITIDPTNDPYHDGLDFSARTKSALWMRGEDGIWGHENTVKRVENKLRGEKEGFGVNEGDKEASYRQLRAIRAMQGEDGSKGGFAAYSKAWNESFGR